MEYVAVIAIMLGFLVNFIRHHKNQTRYESKKRKDQGQASEEIG
jgi:hypothetical protein